MGFYTGGGKSGVVSAFFHNDARPNTVHNRPSDRREQFTEYNHSYESLKSTRPLTPVRIRFGPRDSY